MFRLMSLSKKALFRSAEEKGFPERILLLADLKSSMADIDVIIGSHDRPTEANLAIENYLALEKSTRLRVIVVDSSRNIVTFLRMRRRRQVSMVLVLSRIPCTERKHDRRFWASNGAALAAQLGMYLGRARYAFFSHTDMMGYREDFMSFLLGKMNEKVPLASFMQRHVMPFTGGMLVDKAFFRQSRVDWLPCPDNPYQNRGLDRLRNRIEHLGWIDAGEQFIWEALNRGKKAYVCSSRGATGDFYGHALERYGLTNEAVMDLGVAIRYGPDGLDRHEFQERYPEFARSGNAMWRKCFDDNGNVIFVHRGRGSSGGRRGDRRADFSGFVREFNEAHRRAVVKKIATS